MPPKTKTLINLVFSLLVTGLLIYFLFQETSLEELGEIFSKVDQKYLLYYFVLSISGLLLRAYRYFYLLKKLGEAIAWTPMLIVTAVRNALVDMFPARLGELSFFYMLNRYGISASRMITVFAFCFALDILVLLLIISLIAFFASTQFLEMSASVGPIVLAITLVLGACLFYAEKFVALGILILSRFKFQIFEKPLEILEKVSSSLLELKSFNAYGATLVLTFFLRVAKYGSLYLLLIAVTLQWGLGPQEINPLVSSVSFIVAEAAASLPFSGVMGFGAYEGAFSIIMKATNNIIPAEVTVVFVVHIITQLVGYSIGIIGAIAFSLSKKGQHKINGN